MTMESSEEQFGLFTDIQDKLIYELPINERVRNFLRLEFLFQLMEYSIDKTTEWDCRQCINSLIEINELISRTDIKGELIKELDKNLQQLHTLKSNPKVDSQLLDDMLNHLQDAVIQLKNNSYHPGAAIRQDEMINSIRQRISIAGGTCNFDLPCYHYWLRKNTGERRFQLNRWSQDLEYMQSAIRLVLRIMRTGAEVTQESTLDGFFQYSMSQERSVQLVRILLSTNDAFFPEISGGKHRFSVRFLEQHNSQQRPSPLARKIDFEMQCCY